MSATKIVVDEGPVRNRSKKATPEVRPNPNPTPKLSLSKSWCHVYGDGAKRHVINKNPIETVIIIQKNNGSITDASWLREEHRCRNLLAE